ILIFHKTKSLENQKLKSVVLRNLVFIITGLLASFLGSMLGVGGGIMIAPILIFLGIASRNAAATSATSLLVASVIGTLSQLYFSISY
ncbi:TSUP family transporter, partial [Escherichia coli]|uniref:TSUP family transporter n=1 Tax=Escherichia coli TaxID=562 RepID=UPI0024AEFC9C